MEKPKGGRQVGVGGGWVGKSEGSQYQNGR